MIINNLDAFAMKDNMNTNKILTILLIFSSAYSYAAKSISISDTIDQANHRPQDPNLYTAARDPNETGAQSYLKLDARLRQANPNKAPDNPHTLALPIYPRFRIKFRSNFILTLNYWDHAT